MSRYRPREDDPTYDREPLPPLRSPIRATEEIREELRNVNYELGSDHGRQRIADPAIRAGLGRRRRELKDELATAVRRLEEETGVPAWPTGILSRVSREAYNAVGRARGFQSMTPAEREQAARSYDRMKERT
jgi:hypothetical protein